MKDKQKKSRCMLFEAVKSRIFTTKKAPAKKLSNDFSGALRTFTYFMASGTHYMLKDVEYLRFYGTQPSVIEMVYAIFANVIEIDSEGNVLNFTYAQQRATGYLRSYCDPSFTVTPPLEDWETELYGPPAFER